MRKKVAIFGVLILAVALRASAQMKAGETSLNLNGTVSGGYTDDNSNFLGSDHGIVFGGAADMVGSYYNPNFLSFSVQPYYNQSRENSTFQSLTASSGANASAQIFGGSHIPGSISYSTSFNTSGNYNIPGLASYTTHGNSDVLALTWGLHYQDLPTLNLSFTNANNAYSIYGANAQGTLHSNTFSVSSAYRVAGFNLSGGYQHTGSETLTPEFLTLELPQKSDTDANSLFFGIAHNLPWHGSISAAATRLDLNTDYSEIASSSAGATSSDRFNTDIDTLSGAINFAPRTHFNFGGSAFYTDNLEGTIYNTLVTSGASVIQNAGQQSSDELSVTGHANYELPAEHLVMNASVERQQETFLGISLASDAYNGTVMYSNMLLGGSFNGVLGVTRTSLDTTHQSLTGLNTNVNYAHHIQRWTIAGAVGYSQDTQTVLIGYTTSGYNYSTSLGRRIGRRSYWGIYASGARSLLTDEPGSANSSQSYSTSLSLPRFSINGTFSNSSGNSLLTTAGLVTTPVPLPVVNPADVVLYNGKSYSVGLGLNPVRGMTLTGTFARSLSTTLNNSVNSNNNNENASFLMMYNFRKLSFIAGYSRLVQGFSISGAPPTMLGSFYVGVSRWFNFF